MKKGIICKVLAAGVLAFAASASQAATVVENWDFVLEMSWNTSKTVFTPSDDEPGYYSTPYGVEWLDRGRTVNTPTELSWGSNRSGAQFSHPNYLYARNGIVIEKPRVTGNIATSFEGQTPVVTSANMFSHYNGAISGVADLLTYAQLDVTFWLTPSGSNVPAVKIHQEFDVYFLETPLGFIETPNLGNTGCSYNYDCDVDIFVIVPKIDFTSVFEYGGIAYMLNYFEGANSIQQFDAATCSNVMKSAYTGQDCFGFTTPEHGRNDIMFNLSITEVKEVPEVPEPATYAMLLAGLGMIGVMVRRRKARN